MSLLAWLRRLAVSLGIGATSYMIMLVIMVLSVLFDREAAPVIKLASDAGREIVSAFDALVSGNHWGQVAVNHLRERVNMTHVLLSIPAVLIASVVVGIPLNKMLGGTRTSLQRIAIALTIRTDAPVTPKTCPKNDVNHPFFSTGALTLIDFRGTESAAGGITDTCRAKRDAADCTRNATVLP